MINVHLYPSPFLNESRIQREATSLARLGLFDHIELVGIGQPGLRASESSGNGIKIVRIGEYGSNMSTAQKVAKILDWGSTVYRRYRHERLGCINCHSVTTLPLAVMLKRATGAKLIYDPHELETEANGLHGVRRAGTKQVERLLIRAADHHIFVGQAIEQWYRQQYGLRNTTVLYNCPTSREVAPSDHFRAVLSIPTGKPIFLYQGLLGKGRGLEILVQAFSEIEKSAELVVMGYGPLQEWVVRQTKRYSNVHFHDAVPPDQLLLYTAAADFGLSLIESTSISYDYCMPNKLFEYVMARKPVLASPTIEQRHFVESHGIGEVAARTCPEEVTRAVMRLIERGAASYAVALDRTRSEFCWERQESKLRAAYMDVLGFQRRAGHALADTDLGVAK